MASRTIVLTGASSGIGEAAAKALAARGHRLVPIGRDPDRTRTVAATIGADPLLMDLADLASVRRTARMLMARPGRIDVLALHAGGMFPTYRVTGDGVEAHLQTNHLGHFLLERLLHERLVDDGALVVFTCSLAAHLGTLRSTRSDRSDVRYRMMSAYGDSKLAGLLFIRELVRRSRGTALRAVAFHPGMSATPIASTMGPRVATFARSPLARAVSATPMLLTPEQAGSTLVRLAAGPTPHPVGAHYLGPTGREAVLPSRATDRRLAARVWEWSEQLAGL